MKKSTPPVLKQFANLWTLTDQPLGKKEWSLDEKFRQAKKAGFDAMGGRALPGIAALGKKHGMEYVCYTDADSKSYAQKLELVAKTKPVRVNVQLCDHDTLPSEALQAWLKVEKHAAKLGLTVDLEVHRDTCTETPEKTFEIVRLYKKATGKDLRLCFDYSHFAVVKHLMPPFAPRLLTTPKLLQIARQLHFRPFNGHHCQIPVTNGRGKPSLEIKDYFDFLDLLLASWFAGAKGGEVLYVCPENGPIRSGYGLSSFPDVWKDAIVLRGEIEKLWNKHLRAWKK